MNRFLTKAVPTYNEGEEHGIENWVARFKFEYPWELSFTAFSQDHPDRQFFQELRPVDKLMEEMSADQAMETEVTPGDTLVTFASQGTKRQHSPARKAPSTAWSPQASRNLTKEPYHPFDSQEELDQEVENEKISHINRGFDVSGYSTSQWREWVKSKRLRNLGEAAASAIVGRPRPRTFGLKFRQAHRSPIFQHSVHFQCLSHRERRCDRTGGRKKGAN